MIELSEMLSDCLEQMAAGRSLEEALQRYPHHAAALRPLLELRIQLMFVQVEPDEMRDAQARVRSRVLAHLNRPQAVPMPRRQFHWQRWAALAAAVMALFVVGFTAEASLPGDTLYPVKRFTEQVRLLVLPDDDLAEQFNQRRIDETWRLIEMARAESVSFEGIVEQVEDQRWVISGLPVQIEMDVPAVPVGTQVLVEGVTTLTGVLQAQNILLPAGAVEPPTSDVPLTSTETATIPVPSATDVPTTAPLNIPVTVQATLPPIIPTQLPDIVPDVPPVQLPDLPLPSVPDVIPDLPIPPVEVPGVGDTVNDLLGG